MWHFVFGKKITHCWNSVGSWVDWVESSRFVKPCRPNSKNGEKQNPKILAKNLAILRVKKFYVFVFFGLKFFYCKKWADYWWKNETYLKKIDSVCVYVAIANVSTRRNEKQTHYIYLTILLYLTFLDAFFLIKLLMKQPKWYESMQIDSRFKVDFQH